LRRAGAIILGKTNLTEFADYVSGVMPSGFSGAGGIVRNPHGLAYGRGQGSSVGSAASVAASLAMFAIGTETQNSIQTPAAYSSVVGYKPSVGLVSRAGIFPLVPSQDSPGPLARSVEDARLAASVMAGADIRDTASLFAGRYLATSKPLARLHGVRVGVPRRQLADRPEFSHVLQLFENCLSQLTMAGATIIDPCDLPSADALQDIRSCVFRVEFKAALNAFLEDNDAPCAIDSLQTLIAWNERHPNHIPYGQSLLIAAEQTRGLDDPAYRADRERDIELSQRAGIDAALTTHGVHVLLTPMGAAAKCTGKAGAPVVAIPAGTDPGGVPFGVSLFASAGDDAALLDIALAVEAAIGARAIPHC
jgi:amidase